MIRSTEEKSEMLHVQKKGSKEFGTVGEICIASCTTVCRVPLLSMTSNNTWDYFDASSDKNRVVWYWIASVVQPTIDLGTNFSVATARER
jgi:dipeptidase